MHLRIRAAITIAGFLFQSSFATLIAQDFKTYQSGSNTVEIRTYSAPAAGSILPATLLRDSWNTDGDIRWDLAAVLALFSQQVYNDDKETLNYLVHGMGFTKWVEVRSLDKSKVGHVLSDGDVTVVCFRGTEITDIRDWLANLDVAFITTPEGRFHRGFNDAYHSLRSDISNFLKAANPNRLWVTGHSLGGAMALSCAVDLETLQQMKPTVVTFGQPRYADRNGAKWIDSIFRGRYVRFVRGNDIVPRVPFTIPGLFPYSHAGRYVPISDYANVMPASSVDATLTRRSASCQCCGTFSATKDPIYQPAMEPAPLSETEFRRAIATTDVHVPMSQGPGYACQAMQLQIIPHAITDHLMDGYLALIRRYRGDLPSSN